MDRFVLIRSWYSRCTLISSSKERTLIFFLPSPISELLANSWYSTVAIESSPWNENKKGAHAVLYGSINEVENLPHQWIFMPIVLLPTTFVVVSQQCVRNKNHQTISHARARTIGYVRPLYSLLPGFYMSSSSLRSRMLPCKDQMAWLPDDLTGRSVSTDSRPHRGRMHLLNCPII